MPEVPEGRVYEPDTSRDCDHCGSIDPQRTPCASCGAPLCSYCYGAGELCAECEAPSSNIEEAFSDGMAGVDQILFHWPKDDEEDALYD